MAVLGSSLMPFAKTNNLLRLVPVLLRFPVSAVPFADAPDEPADQYDRDERDRFDDMDERLDMLPFRHIDLGLRIARQKCHAARSEQYQRVLACLHADLSLPHHAVFLESEPCCQQYK